MTRVERPSSARWGTTLILAIVAGALLGWLCARVILVGSALALVPWALVGLAWGWFAADWRVASVCGALYGFVLAFTFMIAGYEGAAPLTSALLPFAGLGLIGAVFGLVCALAGRGLRRALLRT